MCDVQKQGGLHRVRSMSLAVFGAMYNLQESFIQAATDVGSIAMLGAQPLGARKPAPGT